MLRHFRHSLRLLRTSPAFSSTIILTLALGIGLTTAIFSVVDGVLLRPLPYANPSTLITGPSISASTWLDWSRRSVSLDGIALYDSSVPQLLFAGEETSRIRQAAVTVNFLSVLGVRPIVGRDFEPAEGEPGAEPVVILTYAAWQQYFGGRFDVVGSMAPLDPVRRRVIGVLPANFIFPMRVIASAGAVRMLTPISMRSAQESFAVVARLKRGATIGQVRAEYAATVRSPVPQSQASTLPNVTALAETMLGSNRRSLLLLLGAVGFLLLITCANVGTLLFARGADSRKDLAVRRALGARRRDLAGLILSQSCMLSLAGGLVGVLLAYVGFDALMSLVPSSLPRAADVSLDQRALAFALGLSLMSGAVTGLLPAWQLSRGKLQSTLVTQGRATLPAQRLRLIIVATEIALSIVLLSGAALFGRSFIRLLDVDLGFAPRDVLTLKLRTLESRYSNVDQQRAFLDDVLSQLATVTGVRRVGAIEVLPVTRARRTGLVVTVDGLRTRSIAAEPRVISPGYFETMSIGLVVGRPFTHNDVPAAPQVAIVSEGLARRLWPGSNPLGQRIRYEREAVRDIIGVVRDVHSYAIDTTPEPQVYLPYSQTWLIPQQLVVRIEGEPEPVIAAVRQQIREIDPRASAENIQPLAQHVAASIAEPRFQAWLLGVFGGSALVVTLLGLSGVVVYEVSRRRREIGIRLALGASRLHVVRTVMASTLVAVAIGLSLGLGIALALGEVARTFLFEIGPHDPVALGAVAAILGATALVAAWLPARRATGIDPVGALRAE